ncbi:unnamed protein product [Urochloa decumbens]|uniref:Uncharacterized protein n=1 Tax=Urochloa decumbens TaxID=240449 RepID=A0ABC9GFI3_9POAL
MAVAAARVLRGGLSGSSSQPLIPAILRRRAQEAAAALLPRLGSSPAAQAAGAGRLMHTGLGGRGSTKLPQQKALPFGRRGVPSRGHNIMRVEQFSSRRSDTSRSRLRDIPWGPIAFGGAIGLCLGLKK